MLHKSIRDFIVLIAGMIIGAGLASAQSQPSRCPAGDLRIMGFTLGKSMLADVQARLGNSTILKCSHEEEASNEVCYVSPSSDHTRIVFEAGFSGGWKELDGYKVIAGSVDRRCYRQCPGAAQVTSEVMTDGGLKLGLTRDQLIKLLGAPKQVRPNSLTFQWQSRKAMAKEQIEAESRTFKSPVTDAYYDVQDTIDVALAKSKVVEFEVHHIVTY
jgi:hypothetical protein